MATVYGILNTTVEKWLEKLDEEQLIWVEECISGSEEMQNILSDLSAVGRLTSMSPGSEDLPYKLSYIYTCSHLGTKEFLKLKGALSQRKYRKKLKGLKQKPYNFVMGADIESKLKRISKAHNTPSNRALEALINEEISRIDRQKAMKKQFSAQQRKDQEKSLRNYKTPVVFKLHVADVHDSFHQYAYAASRNSQGYRIGDLLSEKKKKDNDE